MATQIEELNRVKERIGHCILKWWARRIAQKLFEFHASDLVDDIVDMMAADGGRVTYESVTRIMRELRLKKNRKLYYLVLSRSDSKYRIVPLDSVEYQRIKLCEH
jgi:hypothetical protein